MGIFHSFICSDECATIPTPSWLPLANTKAVISNSGTAWLEGCSEKFMKGESQASWKAAGAPRPLARHGHPCPLVVIAPETFPLDLPLLKFMSVAVFIKMSALGNFLTSDALSGDHML